MSEWLASRRGWRRVFGELRAEYKRDLAELRGDLRSEFKADLGAQGTRLIIWSFGFRVTSLAAMFTMLELAGVL